jgi:deoxyribodipyrimidine photo-lyase
MDASLCLRSVQHEKRVMACTSVSFRAFSLSFRAVARNPLHGCFAQHDRAIVVKKAVTQSIGNHFAKVAVHHEKLFVIPMAQRSLVWFRNDLRLHDHEALTAALAESSDILLLYCFDERQFGKLPSGFPKTGKFRAKFLIESVEHLRQAVRERGGELLVRMGKPEQIIADLAGALGITSVYFHQEATSEEQYVESALRQNLNALGVRTREFWGSTLYHKSDLPMSIEALPDVFTNFRKQVEKHAQVRPLFPTPTRLKHFADVEAGEVPTLQGLGLEEPQPDVRAVMTFKGGESQGLQRLHEYIWQKDLLKTYKDTRNGLIGADYSSKLSPWLANGCLSPRKVYEEVKKYEAQRIANDSTYWLIFELLWRDYFRFIALKYGNRIFHKFGIKGKPREWSHDREAFERWVVGKTGQPFIDANMRELAATGFMSNRGRQNVASYLVHDLNVDWRWGAEYFESVLIDYDVCSNYGNWNYVAGIGNDPREDRYFNPKRQAALYDPKAEFIKRWIPELSSWDAKRLIEADSLEYT